MRQLQRRLISIARHAVFGRWAMLDGFFGASNTLVEQVMLAVSVAAEAISEASTPLACMAEAVRN